MKKIYGIIIAIAACVLCVCTFFAVRSQIQNQNELNNLEKEAAPYQDEINDIYADLQSRKQKLGSSDNSNVGATLAFVPASANDIDTIKELMTGYDFTPTIIADCSIDSKELDSIIRKSQNNNYDILLSGMTFDDDILASAIKVRNNLAKNNYNLMIQTMPVNPYLITITDISSAITKHLHLVLLLMECYTFPTALSVRQMLLPILLIRLYRLIMMP